MKIFTIKTIIVFSFAFVSLLVSVNVFAQIITNYSFSASSGAYTSIPSNGVAFSGGSFDDGYFNNLAIGFDFWYMGSRYTTVSASTNGWLTLGTTISSSSPNNNLTSGTPRPIIAPLWDDLYMGGLDYNTTGTAPNRIFTVQYVNVKWKNSASTSSLSFQIKFYEGNGIIQFVYNQAPGTTNVPLASIGIAANGNGSFLSLNNSGSSPTVSSILETTKIATKPASGQIYSFVPPVPIAPTNIVFTYSNPTQGTLTWSQTSSNELGFAIYASTDNVNFIYQGLEAANVTSKAYFGLSNGTTYYWKVLAVTEGALSSATQNWTGLVGTDWDNGNNWYTKVVPAPSTSLNVTNVNIPSVTNMPILNSNVTCNNINLNGTVTTLSLNDKILSIAGDLPGTGSLIGSATAGLTISGAGPAISLRFMQTLLPADRTLFNYTQTRGATVTVTTPLEIINKVDITGSGAEMQSAGYLTLKSSISGTGSTATIINANVDNLTSATALVKVIQGNVNVESWFTGGVNYRSFRGVSSPINDNAAPLTDAVNVVAPLNTYSQLKKWMLVTGASGGGFDAGGSLRPFATTIKTYKESNAPAVLNQFVPIPLLSTKIDPGLGFFVYFRGDRTVSSSKLNGTAGVYPDPTNTKVTYTGQINQGDVSVPVTFTNFSNVYDGFNLVGNPYPSVINWQTVYSSGTNSTTVNNTIYVLRPDGSFNVWASGVSTPASASSIIQPGQGLYVISRSGGGTLKFTEASKSVLSAPMRLLSTPQEKLQMSSGINKVSEKTIYPGEIQKLRISLQDNTNTDETLVVFENGNLSTRDEKDAPSFGASTVLLTSLTSDNIYLTINFMPELREVKEVKLYLNASVSGPLKMNFSELPTVNYQVFLRDEYLDKMIDVRANPTYTFDIDLAKANSVGAERFKVLFVALPTKLGTFSAKKVKYTSELNWSTINELDNDHFDIEKSRDGKIFEKIAQVKGAGTSSVSLNYSFTDKDPATGINYYRLKQVGLDGKILLSDTVFVEFEKLANLKNAVVMLYPNPAHNQISIQFKESFRSEVKFRLSDASGRLVKSQTIKADVNPVSLDISSLSSGMYIIEFLDLKNNKVISRNKFIKE